MEMDEIYANCEHNKSFQNSDASQNPSGSRTSEKSFHRAVVLSLVLLSVLLLAGLIGLGVYSFVLTKGRDQLQADLNVIAEDREQLKADLAVMSGNVFKLQNLLGLRETCAGGWTRFKCSFYYQSSTSGSWTTARDDCRSRGADLVVINSDEEQTFLSDFSKDETWSWIGLTEGEDENTWRWIDGTPLNQSYWEENQPDNGGGSAAYGEEDCAHIRTGKKTKQNWNDRSCNVSLLWICEMDG